MTIGGGKNKKGIGIKSTKKSRDFLAALQLKDNQHVRKSDIYMQC
ncbi:hypothetical protein MMC2321_03871 [Chitinophaga sp. MM2321]